MASRPDNGDDTSPSDEGEDEGSTSNDGKDDHLHDDQKPSTSQ